MGGNRLASGLDRVGEGKDTYMHTGPTCTQINH